MATSGLGGAVLPRAGARGGARCWVMAREGEEEEEKEKNEGDGGDGGCRRRAEERPRVFPFLFFFVCPGLLVCGFRPSEAREKKKKIEKRERRVRWQGFEEEVAMWHPHLLPRVHTWTNPLLPQLSQINPSFSFSFTFVLQNIAYKSFQNKLSQSCP